MAASRKVTAYFGSYHVTLSAFIFGLSTATQDAVADLRCWEFSLRIVYFFEEARSPCCRWCMSRVRRRRCVSHASVTRVVFTDARR